MRVLLDQCTPAPIRSYLTKHQVSTAYEQGWGTLLNGNLIKAAEDGGFDVLLTADSHMMKQQNLSNETCGHRPKHKSLAVHTRDHTISCDSS